MSKNLGILISGRGSNMLAITKSIRQKKLNAKISIVISNNTKAGGIELAQKMGLEVAVVNPKNYTSHEEYEKQIIKILKAKKVDLVILAGYMKLLKKPLLTAFAHKIMNIHPSLLPSFKGLHAQKQALDYGVKYSGCTVHFVDESLDGGPIILQKTVPVFPDDNEDSLSARILKEEHRLYSKAIQLFFENKLSIKNKIVYIK